MKATVTHGHEAATSQYAIPLSKEPNQERLGILPNTAAGLQLPNGAKAPVIKQQDLATGTFAVGFDAAIGPKFPTYTGRSSSSRGRPSLSRSAPIG